jgi:MFS family permease
MSGLVKRADNVLHWAIAGGVIFVVSLFVVPWLRSPWLVGACVALGYGVQALVWPALHAWVGAEPDPKLRARRMGWFNLSWSGGFAVMPLLAGPLYDLDYRLPFVMLGIVGTIAVLLIMSLPHERDLFPALTDDMRAARAHHDGESAVFLYAAWFAVFTSNVLVGITRAVFPKRVEELVATGNLRVLFETEPWLQLSGAEATAYSWLAFLLSLATAGTFVVLSRTVTWQHRTGLLFGVQAAGGLAFFVLGFTNSLVVMLAAFAVVGGGLGVVFFSSAYYSVADPLHKHRRATINEGAVGMGIFLGSIVFGQLAATYGILLPLRWSPVFIAMAIAVQWGLLRRSRARQLRLALATTR